MGWEKRGDNWYYYRKRREGDKVISEYVGPRGDPLTEAVAQLEALDRQRRELEAEEWRRKREKIEANDRLTLEIDRLARSVWRAWLLALGYHTHHGEWRRWNDGIPTDKHNGEGDPGTTRG